MKTIADSEAARELELYIENESSLVGDARSIGKAIEANQTKHIKAGRWTLEQATIGYMHLIDVGAKAYVKGYCGERVRVQDVFNKATLMMVARRFAEAFWTEYRIHNELPVSQQFPRD